MIFSSKGSPGKAVASLPVAIMVFLAEIVSFFPSIPVTSLSYVHLTWCLRQWMLLSPWCMWLCFSWKGLQCPWWVKSPLRSYFLEFLPNRGWRRSHWVQKIWSHGWVRDTYERYWEGPLREYSQRWGRFLRGRLSFRCRQYSSQVGPPWWQRHNLDEVICTSRSSSDHCEIEGAVWKGVKISVEESEHDITY